MKRDWFSHWQHQRIIECIYVYLNLFPLNRHQCAINICQTTLSLLSQVRSSPSFHLSRSPQQSLDPLHSQRLCSGTWGKLSERDFESTSPPRYINGLCCGGDFGIGDTKIAPVIVFCDILKLLFHKHIPPQTLLEEITACSPSLPQKFAILFAGNCFHFFSLCNSKDFSTLSNLSLQMYNSIFFLQLSHDS